MDDIVDVYWLWHPLAAHVGNLAQHCKWRSLSANQIGIKQAQLMVNQQIMDHITGEEKSMKKNEAQLINNQL